MKISALVPAFNEKDRLANALKSLSFVDEIIVIDSYSTDNTIEIANSFDNVKVIQREFDDFSSHKNFGISQCTHTWILALDADEVITESLQKEITSLDFNTSESQNIVAYKIPRNNYFLTKFLKHGPNGKEKILRLFKKDKCHFEGVVHENLICDGTTASLTETIEHHTFQSLRHFLIKKNRYADFQAQQLIVKKKQISLVKLFIKPFSRIVIELFVKGGIKDGIPGIAISQMNGYGVLTRYLKQRNLENKTKDELLNNLDEFSLKLYDDTLANFLRLLSKKGITSTSLLLQPFFCFWGDYLFNFQIFKGFDGFFKSSFKSFECYLRLMHRYNFNQKTV